MDTYFFLKYFIWFLVVSTAKEIQTLKEDNKRLSEGKSDTEDAFMQLKVRYDELRSLNSKHVEVTLSTKRELCWRKFCACVNRLTLFRLLLKIRMRRFCERRSRR